MNKRKLTWAEVDIGIYEIYRHYKDAGLTQIVAISRGGLVIGVKLSNLLGIPLIPVVWQIRDGEIKDDLTLEQLEVKEILNTLFVDDICDTGTTIWQINQWVPDARWCTLITKLDNTVEYSPGKMFGNKEWIIFPWEE